MNATKSNEFTDLSLALSAMRTALFKEIKINVKLTGEVSNFWDNHGENGILTLGLENGQTIPVYLSGPLRRAYVSQKIRPYSRVTITGNLTVYSSGTKPPAVQVYASAIEKLSGPKTVVLPVNDSPKPITVLNKIAVIGSGASQGVNDFRKGLCQPLSRDGNFILYDTPMTGDAAIQGIKESIEKANAEGKADLICITRGGGDAYALSYVFNNEEVCDAIMASRLPVLVAIGHSADNEIQAERVADIPYKDGKRQYYGVPADLARAVNQIYYQLHSRNGNAVPARAMPQQTPAPATPVPAPAPTPAQVTPAAVPSPAQPPSSPIPPAREPAPQKKLLRPSVLWMAAFFLLLIYTILF